MLFKALAVFAMRNINLTKVSSTLLKIYWLFLTSRVDMFIQPFDFNSILAQIESRPLQKQALRVLDDSVDGFPKYVSHNTPLYIYSSRIEFIPIPDNI